MATIPTNPSDGDTFTDGVGVTWTYNSSSNKWLIPVSTSGGGGGGILSGQERYNTGGTASTHDILYDGTYRIIAVGAGGGGAGSNTGGSNVCYGSGGSGALVISDVALSAGDQLAIFIGEGADANNGTDRDGLDANSDTTVTGPGINIVAGSGFGGNRSIGSVDPTVGGAPGIASGGTTFNLDGQVGLVSSLSGGASSGQQLTIWEEHGWLLPNASTFAGQGRGANGGGSLGGATGAADGYVAITFLS